MTITSTYDHRVIQGAESGGFLRRVDGLLGGADDFYPDVFSSLGRRLRQGAAHRGSRWPAGQPPACGRSPATSRPTTSRPWRPAMALVRAYRSFGHLAARLDPLGSQPPGDPALDPEPLGLTPEAMARIPASLLRVDVPGETLAEALPAPAGDLLRHDRLRGRAHRPATRSGVWLRRVIESGEHRRAAERPTSSARCSSG